MDSGENVSITDSGENASITDSGENVSITDSGENVSITDNSVMQQHEGPWIKKKISTRVGERGKGGG